jgi:hypothetical protein
MMNITNPDRVALRRRTTKFLLAIAAAFLLTTPVTAATKAVPAKITTPKEALGFNLGDDYQMATYTQLETYWKQLATESDRLKLVDIGLTAENRHQYMMIISAPENMRKLDHYKQISQQLAHAENLTDDQAHALAREGKAVVWIDGGLHASETVGSQQEMEWVYQMASASDSESLRFLNDTILLCTLANPDGQELVAKWYMREKDPTKRSLENLPTLFQHYIGHDNNRDFYMSNMPESTNMNHQLFIEWFPQIVYNHHQTGPAGAVIFMPPFRDPFNYNFDPLIPLDVEAVGTAMHQRLVEEGKGGSAQRSGANYSTWWNGGLRTIAYFHNMIGLLTEIIGNPTPINIPLVPDKQLPSGDWPLPIAPQAWHYRQSIDYEMTNNRAVTDYASRNRETLLYNLYVMGHRSIQNGSEDHWTITPDRIDELKAAQHTEEPRAGAGNGAYTTVNKELYKTILHDPEKRDARGYVIPSDQADFPTAVKFINTLLKNGITVMQATAPFNAGVQKFPAGSYVIKSAQAFRPHILDMFEPQHHPNDFQYPGGPPIPPYDSAGWTLALQMGVQFSRILEPFDGPFTKVDGLLKPPFAAVTGPEKPAGYLISHRINDSFILINRLLKANCEVYWLKKAQMINGRDFGTGSIWVPATPEALSLIQTASKTLGVDAVALALAPAGDAFQLKPQRIALYDQYGGLMTSGWDRWLFEQYEFPFQVIYPQTLDAGDLKKQFDVIVFTDGAFSGGRGDNPERPNRQPDPEKIPEEYRFMLGRITENKTIPALKKFVDAGGRIIAVGSATRMAKALGVPIDPYVTLPRDKFYVPGSLLKMDVDIDNPLAYGMPDTVDVFFDNSPVFRLLPAIPTKRAAPVGWFSTPKPLVSGWAFGQQNLDGGTAVAEANVGEGKLFLFGPEITFRGQPHATFKFLFNAIDYATAQPITLK